MTFLVLLVALLWPFAVVSGIAWRDRMRRRVRKLKGQLEEVRIEKAALADRAEGLDRNLSGMRKRFGDFLGLPCPHCGATLQSHHWTAVEGQAPIPSCKMASA